MLTKSSGFAHRVTLKAATDVVYPLDKDIFHLNPSLDIDASSWPADSPPFSPFVTIIEYAWSKPT